MVSGDLGMQILPDALDLVVLGAVRRQRMQFDAAPRTPQRPLRQVTAVDAVVVHDHMDHLGLGVTLPQLDQQADEQPTVLLGRRHPQQLPAAGIQGPGQVTLAVLPGRTHLLLLPFWPSSPNRSWGSDGCPPRRRRPPPRRRASRAANAGSCTAATVWDSRRRDSRRSDAERPLVT